MAIFGKALGNGYPIAAVIGKRHVMEHAQDTFISSTFWTERIGFVAALAALKKMETHAIPGILIRNGEKINKGWRDLAARHGLTVHIHGIPPLTHITFGGDDPLAVQTLYTQEMLKKGYLLGAAVYSSYAYSDDIINRFIADSDSVFALIRKALASGDIRTYLAGKVIHAGFKRLT
jgi:glutamate-1-semialdehyde 2,1-aminomutase